MAGEDACATVGCDRPAVVTYLGRLRCQECYADEVDDDDPIEAATTTHKETDMTTSSTKKRGGRTGAKKRASKAARKAAGTRKRPAAATRKPRATAKRKAAKTATSRTAKATRAEANGAATRPSALNAAAEVLRKNGQPMNCRALITAMAEAGLWTSPAGKTPHATLYSAIIREIATKGREARFRKVERGLFEAAT